ncbi:MAG: hypothetical protein NC314_04265 [Roseburia sp.]|nr:hypothetical protein [Roseburia sp.]MCM1242033.1 hypothetical protein [Roseburia sp.]
MKKNITRSKLCKAAAMIGIFLSGSAIGVIAVWQYALHHGITGKEILESDSLITDKIAIVNLDEGVIVQDEKINYAEKLIIDLEDNFFFTGLEDARQGYATGIYAGYMVVPATFSESVVSLNDTPIRAEISYAINDNLRKDVKEEVIYDMLTLMNDINDSVSYMYLHSVLDDFHTAQDEAGTVMDNDLKEKEAINAVQANDLVALVPVTEFTVVENTIEPVDVSDYMMQNMEFTSQIGLKYTEYLLAGETDHMQINEEALLLMDEMNNMSAIMADSNFSQSEDGTSFYQEGTEALESMVEEYNTSLGEKEAEISANVLTMYEDINLYLTAYDRTVAAYLMENATAYDNTLKALEELLEEYQKNYILVSMEEMQTIEETLQAQDAMLLQQQSLISELKEEAGGESGSYVDNNIMDAEEDQIEDIFSGNEQTEDSEQEDELPVFEQEEIPDSMESVELIETSLRAQPVSRVYKLRPCTTKEESGLEEDTKPDTVTAPEEGTLGELQEKILEEFQADYFLFSGYLLDEEGEIVLDEEGNKILLTSLLEQYRKDLDDPLVKEEILKEEVGTLNRLDPGVLQTCINDNILTPIQEKVNSFTEAVMAQYEIEQEQLLTYNEAIMTYDPISYINYDEIQLLTEDMMDNGVNLSTAILETDIQQMEYVADVYATTREDLFTLQDNIIQAKADSDKAVEEGLQDLKDTKNENSVLNQQILYDFSTKLPYTRLGSLEYVQAYEFMVNPISALNSTMDGKGLSARTDSVRAESDSVNVQAKRQADYQNISIMICVVICVIIVAATIKYHFHKKEESYETE